MATQTPNLIERATASGADDVDALRREVAKIDWWHQIDLGHGIITPGRDRSREKLARLRMPGDLRGWGVLDIGAWDGFFSFEAERRGAARVVAVDHYNSPGDRWGGDAGFRVARRALQSRVESIDADLMELSPQAHGRFDLVLLLGVLYHLKHPLLGLERAAAMTTRQLILETHVDMLWNRRPSIAFYPGGELKGDHTNWCGPNVRAVEAMLRTAGFRRVEVVWREPMGRRLQRAIGHLLGGRVAAFVQGLQQARVVVHAYK